MRIAIIGSAILSSMVAAGCASGRSTPRAPMPACSPGQEVPSAQEILDAQTRAAEKLQSENLVVRPVDWSSFAAVKFTDCPMWIENAVSEVGGRAHGAWADGVTDDENHIRVTTRRGKLEALALIEWEQRNCFLIKGGRRDLAH